MIKSYCKSCSKLTVWVIESHTETRNEKNYDVITYHHEDDSTCKAIELITEDSYEQE